MKLRVLDLFCKAGGAGMGYKRAGFEIVGIDIEPQPNYPGEFYQMDAIAAVQRYGNSFDVIHASPPCQYYTTLTQGTNQKQKRKYPALIESTRHMLNQLGKPYIIENVMTAPVRPDIVLCGEMFGLAVIRHRKFELGFWHGLKPEHVKHRGRVAGMRHSKWFTGPYFAVYGEGGGKGTVAEWREAMDIDWTWERKELAEAIPPAYTEFIGRQLTKRYRTDIRELRVP